MEKNIAILTILCSFVLLYSTSLPIVSGQFCEDLVAECYRYTEKTAIKACWDLYSSVCGVPPTYKESFEFDIDVQTFETVQQGGLPVSIPVYVMPRKGTPQQVELWSGDWQSVGISSWFDYNPVSPSSDSPATWLNVQASCSTPSDNYEFRISGVTEGTTFSSVDSVTVYVEPDSSCSSDDSRNRQSDDTSSASASINAAKNLIDSGNYEEALDVLYDVLMEDPNNTDAWFQEGLALIKLGRNEEALDVYDKVIELNPSDYVAWNNKGVALENLGRYDESLDAYEESLQINPSYELAINNKNNVIEKVNTANEGNGDDESQSSGDGDCLIATAAFGSELAPQVQMLRETRDNIVMQTKSGAAFMTGFNSVYYSFAPTIAEWERQNPIFKEIVKVIITPLITTLSILNYMDIDSEVEMLGYGIGIILLNIGMYFVAPTFVIFRLKKHKK